MTGPLGATCGAHKYSPGLSRRAASITVPDCSETGAGGTAADPAAAMAKPVKTQENRKILAIRIGHIVTHREGRAIR